MTTTAFVIALLCAASVVLGEHCVKPEVQPKVFVSSESVLSSDVVIVGEFKVTCSNKPQSLNLHAEFDGELFPVTQSIDGGSYQFTVIKKPKFLQVGVYSVRIYDEQGANALRKAQNSAGKTDDIKPTFTIDVDYKGPNKGLMVPTEVLALGGGISFSLLAFQARSRLN